MTTCFKRWTRPFVIGTAGLCLLVLLASCTANVDLGTDFLPNLGADADADGDSDSATEPYFDTGLGPYECPGQYLTLDQCLGGFGSVDPSLNEPVCIDEERRYCCVLDSLTGPCQHDCTTFLECNLRGNDTDAIPDTVTGPHAQCPLGTQVCCASEPLPVVEPDTGSLYSPADCPIDPQDLVDTDQQPNKLATQVCAQYMREQAVAASVDTDSDTDSGTGGVSVAADWWFCPQALYNRIDRDLSLLDIEYPVMKHSKPRFAEHSERVLCKATEACVEFPLHWFDELATCFGEFQVDCRYPGEQTCGESHLYFGVSLNTWRALPWFEEHAKAASADSVCEIDGGETLTPPAGYRFRVDSDTDSDPVNDWWEWTLRARSQCEPLSDICHCDFTFIGYTSGDMQFQHMNKYVNEEAEADFSQCASPEFLEDTHPQY